MAVFTPVSMADLESWIVDYPLGRAKSIRGISSGIENSNFFLDTEAGEFVLTVFEKLTFEQLPFYLELMRHLADRGVLVPAPVATKSGDILNRLHGKPAAIVSKLAGKCQLAPGPVHCAAVGAMLARMHLAGQDFAIRQPNLRGLDWWAQTVPVVRPHVDAALARRLDEELAFQQRFHAAASTQSLPRGPVHADLFRDNALFDGPPEAPRLSGVFDFYFAGVDHHVYDLAVCVNDWCVDLATGRLEPEHAQALLRAYHVHRPMSPAELRALPAMRRAAALRFWLSRLADWYLPREAALLKPKDPTHFERVLVDCIEQPWHPEL